MGGTGVRAPLLCVAAIVHAQLVHCLEPRGWEELGVRALRGVHYFVFLLQCTLSHQLCSLVVQRLEPRGWEELESEHQKVEEDSSCSSSAAPRGQQKVQHLKHIRQQRMQHLRHIKYKHLSYTFYRTKLTLRKTNGKCTVLHYSLLHEAG